MVPLELQDELEKRLEKLFKHTRLKNLKGELVPINIFTQHLPAKSKTQEVSDYPYVLIRLAEGSELDEEDPQSAKVLFIAGVVDRESNHQGYRDAVSLIQRIYQDVKKYPIVKKRFELQYPINWAYHDEDTEPYFFAGLETNWGVPKVMREDLEAML